MDTEALAAAIRRVAAGESAAVILEAPGGYVQFAQQGRDALLCEAAGEANLSSRMTPTQHRLLIDRRFAPPGRDGGGNHQRIFPGGTPPEELAHFALETLAEVYGAAPAQVSLNEV